MDSITQRVRILAGPLAFFVAVSLLAGCYTAFRHPGAPDLTGEDISRERSCYDCHEEAEFYHSYYGVHFGYYASPWFGYYSDPWWFDSYWLYDDSDSPAGIKSGGRRQLSTGAPSGTPRGAQGSSGAPAYLKPGYSKQTGEPSGSGGRKEVKKEPPTSGRRQKMPPKKEAPPEGGSKKKEDKKKEDSKKRSG